MADAENGIPPSKKRAAGRDISKDDPELDEEEEYSEQELGTFQKASDEVLATRKIVKVRRQAAAASVQSSNPFTGIRLVPSKAASETPNVDATGPEAIKGTEGSGDKEGLVVATKEAEKEDGDINQNKVTDEGNGLENKEVKDASESKTDEVASDIVSVRETLKKSEVDKSDTADQDGSKENENSSGDATNLTAFQQLSGSKNAFTGFAGTGFSGSAFSFNPISNDGTASGDAIVSPSGLKCDQPLFGFGLSANGNTSLFGTKESSLTKIETSSAPSLQEVPTETGEENERVVFAANSALFEFLDGGWKERGRGEVKVNVSTTEGSKARLVMRSRGNYRLILNASLYPEMKLTYMDKKGMTFACMNSNGEGAGALSTFALKFKEGSIADEFHAAVTSNKGTQATVLKTPENSPQ